MLPQFEMNPAKLATRSTLLLGALAGLAVTAPLTLAPSVAQAQFVCTSAGDVDGATAGNPGAVACGTNATAGGVNSTAVGPTAKATGDSSTTQGLNSTASGLESTADGFHQSCQWHTQHGHRRPQQCQRDLLHRDRLGRYRQRPGRLCRRQQVDRQRGLVGGPGRCGPGDR